MNPIDPNETERLPLRLFRDHLDTKRINHRKKLFWNSLRSGKETGAHAGGWDDDHEEPPVKALSPQEAAATVAYLRRSVSQPNSWEMLRGKAKPNREHAAAPSGQPQG